MRNEPSETLVERVNQHRHAVHVQLSAEKQFDAALSDPRREGLEPATCREGWALALANEHTKRALDRLLECRPTTQADAAAILDYAKTGFPWCGLHADNLKTFNAFIDAGRAYAFERRAEAP